MAEGIKTVVHPVKDLARAKALFTGLHSRLLADPAGDHVQDLGGTALAAAARSGPWIGGVPRPLPSPPWSL